MSADHNNHDITSISSYKNHTPSDHDEKFTQLLIKFVSYQAPRLFTLCRESVEDAQDWVFSWGVAFSDSAVTFDSDGKFTGTFTTADTALRLSSRVRDLRLIWVDPAVRIQPDAIAA